MHGQRRIFRECPAVRACCIPALLLASLSPPAGAQGDDLGNAQPHETPPQILETLSKVVAAYQTPNTYYEKSRIAVPAKVERVTGRNHVVRQLWFRRPNLVKIKAPDYELICDGKQLLLNVKKLRQYVIQNAPAEFSWEWFTSEPFAETALSISAGNEPVCAPGG